MNCLASSFGLLKYDWSKRDGILPQTAVQSYIIHSILFDPLSEQTTDIYNLAVYNVQPSDEGWYCCGATNKAGSTVDCAWLEVNSKLPFSLVSKSYSIPKYVHCGSYFIVNLYSTAEVGLTK